MENLNQSETVSASFMPRLSTLSILLSFVFICFVGQLSAQTDLSADILQIQNSDVSLDVLHTTLTTYNENPQNFSLPFVYNDLIISAIVDAESFEDLQRQGPVVREYFTTPDEDERKIYEDMLLRSISEFNN